MSETSERLFLGNLHGIQESHRGNAHGAAMDFVNLREVGAARYWPNGVEDEVAPILNCTCGAVTSSTSAGPRQDLMLR